MQECGGLTLKMGSEEQAAIAKSIVLDYCEDEWAKALKQNGEILTVDEETHIYMYDYPGKVLTICKEIAEKHPDFSFIVNASGSDDEGFYSCSEEGSFKDGVFEYVQTESCVKEPDFDEIDFEDFDPDEMLNSEKTTEIITRGELVDGVMRFTTTEKEID